MDGCVYKIEFPCGRFYIGSSKHVGTRVRNHYWSDSYVGELVRSSFDGIDELFDCVKSLYSGPEYRMEERKRLFYYRNNKLMLNKSIPKKIRKIKKELNNG